MIFKRDPLDKQSLLKELDSLGYSGNGIGGGPIKILITGFEPFGGEPINPSLEAVQRLENRIAGAELIKRSLPVIFQKAAGRLTGYMEEDRPDVVICIGQAGKSKHGTGRYRQGHWLCH